MLCKVMSLRTKEDGLLQKVLVFIHDLAVGDQVTGTIIKLFRSQRNDGQLSGALVKIGDRNSDVGFIPGRYLPREQQEQQGHRRRGTEKKKKNSLDVGDAIIAEVLAINPRVESYESETILKFIRSVPRRGFIEDRGRLPL